MKKIDYETLFNYISLILAITIFGVIVYICYFKKNVEKFETEETGDTEDTGGDTEDTGDTEETGDTEDTGDNEDTGDDKEEVTAVGKAIVRNKEIKDIRIENAGKGYGSPPMIIITDSKGKNAQAVARIAYGTVTDVTILNGGEKYSRTQPPTITFESPKQAEANKNSVVPLGDKKDTILELIENCNKLEREQKDKFKSRIENDALRKLEVEGLLSILND